MNHNGWCSKKTGYICLEHVKERDAQTLQSYIEAHAEEDGIHITDGWKGYYALNKRGSITLMYLIKMDLFIR